jgi:hypothetical protein
MVGGLLVYFNECLMDDMLLFLLAGSGFHADSDVLMSSHCSQCYTFQFDINKY